MAPKRAALVVIDGYGDRAEEYGNAILQADTPNMDACKAGGNWVPVEGSGLAVGLPEGVMGNSEVGHLTIGAGQVEYQDLVRINLSVTDGTMAKQEAIVNAFAAAKSGTGRLHMFGLLSDGSVHSHIDHLKHLLAIAKEAGVPRTLLHCCLDGRDTPPTSGAGYVKQIAEEMTKLGYGEVSTLTGRYWAMDRDKRWERVKDAYDCMCRAPGGCESVATADLEKFVTETYSKGEGVTDEFFKPTPVLADGGIADGDVIFFFNFRADRAREIFEALSVEPPFETDVKRSPAMCVQFARYNSAFTSPIVFPPQQLVNGLSETISKLGLKQFHVAETEK